ncbi:hypothetical protein PWT90_04583 [Aphanocladium album]|nr:hypothetical protein PWT90_04583 [Aphanocladium album]
MKFLALTLATAGAALAATIGAPCGDNYGQEVCGEDGVGDARSYVVVCNDQYVWAIRQACGGKYCCKDKPEGGAYCRC